MIPNGVHRDYLEIDDVANVRDLPGDFDAVPISSYSAQVTESWTLADRFALADVIVVLRGLHVAAGPEEALRPADSIVIGEGEPVWPQLIRDLLQRRLRSTYDSTVTPFNPGSSPMPLFDMLDTERYNRLTVQTQRGCPFDREFCAASIRLSPIFRTKAVDRVVTEIRHIEEIWPTRFIESADDNTVANKKRTKELLRAQIPEDIRWFRESDISLAPRRESVSGACICRLAISCSLAACRSQGIQGRCCGAETEGFSACDDVEIVALLIDCSPCSC